MRLTSFKLITFFIVLICVTDFVMSMPMPMPASKKAPKKAVAKKPSPKAPAKKPAAKAPAKKPATKAPTKTPATKAPAKKPASTTNKPATKSPAKKPATTTKKPAITAPTKKPATTTKKPVTTAKKPATAAPPKKPAVTTTPAKKPATAQTTAKKPVATKKPANSTADACPLPKKPAAKATTGSQVKAAAKKPREWFEAVVSLFKRDEFEFVGFHGTNGENGDVYIKAAKEKKSIVIPPRFNGNDGELSGGLYITDDFLTAQVFAGSSASSRINDAKLKKCPLDEKTDPAAQPVICKVEAKSSTSFRTRISKIWIPPNEIAESVRGKNNPEKLKQQIARIQSAQMNPTNTLRFSVLNKVDPKNEKFGNQLMLPPGAFGDFIPRVFSIKQCVPLKAGKPGGTTEFPAFNYRNQDADWNIAGNPFGDE
ncbi:hypothetical protein V5O48_016712 [Marasmius crinis-equi]|uniref:Uncharacterized protein n=1 Tax=Marasmius crinis-equi TaxID=585013 RepID=A0ABR3EQZ1_9AGAR